MFAEKRNTLHERPCLLMAFTQDAVLRQGKRAGPGVWSSMEGGCPDSTRAMRGSANAGLLTGEAAVLALHRLAQCPREQHAQLRTSAPFTQLLGLLEKQASSLGPKVHSTAFDTLKRAVMSCGKF